MQLTPSIFSCLLWRIASRATKHSTSWAVCSCGTGRYWLPRRGRSRACPAHTSNMPVCAVGVVKLPVAACRSDVVVAVVIWSQLVDLAQKVAQHRGINLVILGPECRYVDRDGVVCIQHRLLVQASKCRLHALLASVRERPKVSSGIVEHPMHALICSVIDFGVSEARSHMPGSAIASILTPLQSIPFAKLPQSIPHHCLL